MKTRFHTIQALEAAILEEAKREIREMMAEAEAQARQIQQSNQIETTKMQQVILDRAQQKADSLLEHAVAAAQMEAQALKLQRREHIIADVFNAVQQQLPNVSAWPNYDEVARYLLREAVLGLKVAHLIVHTDNHTQTHLDDTVFTALGAELGCTLERGAPLQQGIGVLVETPDGHRRYANTLEARLERMRSTLRTPVYRRLMGGKY